jgi:uncharacterized protein
MTMSLNENAGIDTTQVTDARGSRGAGGSGGLRLPSGGGTVGLLLVLGLVIVGAITGVNFLGGGDPGSGDDLSQTCATANPDRLKQRDCRNALYVNSIQNYWGKVLPELYGKPYQMVDTVFFSQAAQSGCGQAESGMGPFYCPVDHLVYIDLSFYDELAARFGASGEFAQPYVLAHAMVVAEMPGTASTAVSKSMSDEPPSAETRSLTRTTTRPT